MQNDKSFGPSPLVDPGDFPSLGRIVNGFRLAYFDGPAGVQVPRQVIEAISWYYSTCNANAHGHFVTSRESDEAVLEARRAVADFLGADGPGNISFGANMTTLAFALSRAIGRSLHPGDEIVITQLDHEANRGPWLSLREAGAVLREVRLKPDGLLDEQDLAEKINERTRLVAIGYASNALGTVNNIPLARRLSRQAGAWLVVDAVHYAPHFLVDFHSMGADFLLCSAYKFYGPHVGILCSKEGVLERCAPDRLRTQDQRAPFRIETGTLNHAALVGVRAAVDFIASLGEGAGRRWKIVSAMGRIQEHEGALARYFYRELARIRGVRIYGPSFEVSHRAPTVSFTLERYTAAQVAESLGREGLLVWDGDFYAVRAVEALGLVEQGGLVRVGMSAYTTRDDVQRLLAAIARLAEGTGI